MEVAFPVVSPLPDPVVVFVGLPAVAQPADAVTSSAKPKSSQALAE